MSRGWPGTTEKNTKWMKRKRGTRNSWEEEEDEADPKLLLKEADPVELREALSAEVAILRREVDRRRAGSTLLLLWQCFNIADHLSDIVSDITEQNNTTSVRLVKLG